MDDTSKDKRAPESAAGKGVSRRGILIGVLLLLAAVVALRFFPLQEYMRGVLNWADGLGFWGPIVAAAAYIPACVFFLPGSILTMGIGALFGLLYGTIAVSIGSTLGATVAFILGRTVARGYVEKKAADSAKFGAVDKAVGEKGWKIVLLTRLSPVFPFNFQNYAYGLTKVRLRDYMLASWIGMLPGTIMYVYIGAALGSLAEVAAEGERTRTPFEWTMYAVGLVATVLVTIYITRIARRALKQAIPEAESGEPADAGNAESDLGDDND